MYPILISVLEEPPRNNINQNQWGDNYKKSSLFLNIIPISTLSFFYLIYSATIS